MSQPPKFFFNFDPAFQADFTKEVFVRAFEPQRPIPQNPQLIIYRTRLQQLRAYYTRPQPNTPHPDLPQVYFADDLDFQDRTAGMVEWTRIHVTLPPEWLNTESYPYEYPGYQGTTAVLGRNPFTHTVTSKLVNDYFIVGNLPTFANLLANYDDFSNASWVKTGASATASAAAVPVCAVLSTLAAKIVESNTNAIHIAAQASNATAGLVAGAAFIQAAERTKVRVGFANSTGTAPFADVLVDLNTGQPTNNALSNYAVAAIGEGWWRVDVIANAPAGNAALVVALCDNGGNLSYLGNGSSGLYAWRGQMVNGNSVPHATVPPATTPDGGGYPIATADLIPVKFGTRYLYQVPWGFGNSNATAAQFVAGYLSDGGFGLIATSPTLTNYKGWVTTDSGNTNTNSYSIEAHDSVQSLWVGSIWLRQRRFVKAI